MNILYTISVSVFVLFTLKTCDGSPVSTSGIAGNLIEAESSKVNPIELFGQWYQSAKNNADIKEANVMSLATASKDAVPSIRYMHLAEFNSNGFTFFTNTNSQKAKEINENPVAAVAFYWDALGRSVRVQGSVSRLSEAEATEYFNAQPKESQLRAVISNQGEVIENRDILDDKLAALEGEYAGSAVSKPEGWGGYTIKPNQIEFWEKQNNGIHDRILFKQPASRSSASRAEGKRTSDGNWIIERLAP